ncbi:HAMP domain-containing histidine kinase [Deferribacteraceae bacterium V6Fe1]|nr:HAMP domain-containing histidine kinase [Deferribacteraceae bacterium V6Fe1]
MTNIIYNSISYELDIIANKVKNKIYLNKIEDINNEKYLIKIISDKNNIIFANKISQKVFVPIYNKKDTYNYRTKISKEIIDLGQDEWNEVLLRVKLYKLKNNYTLLIAKSIENIDEQIVQLSKILFLIFISSMVILLLLTNWLLNKIILPFQNVIKNISEVNTSNLSIKIPTPKENDEICLLISSLNEMLQRLDRQFKLQKDFISDISHELKTPFTIILLSLEKLIQNTELKEKDKEDIAQLYKTIQRLSLLIKNLLMLLSLESNINSIDFRELNLSQLIKELLEICEINIENKNILLKKEIENNIKIRGNKELLNRLFMNLLDNAVKYCNTKGVVRIKFYKENNEIILSVYNTGKGINSEEKAFIFNRFFKINKSRSNIDGSFGIGLSIVKEIAKIHNGKISVESDGETYTEFIIKLPINLRNEDGRIC